jgi:hypothetical protein
MLVKHMMHGQCGVLNSNKTRMNERGYVQELLPRFFHDTTQQRKDPYLIYNRRDDGESAEA